MPAPRPPFPWRLLCLLAGLLLAAAAVIHSQRPPRPLGLDAPATAFSATRARAHLDWIAAEPHPVGSPAHARVRGRLVEAFRQAGLEVVTQRAQVPTRQGLAWVENVVARWKGREGGGAIMVACHYDSVPGSYGAADDGAGIAASLEILRALQGGIALKHDLVFLVTDGEELGLLGAQAFVLHHPWAADVKRVLNLEARGTGGPAHMFETSSGNLDLVRALAASWPHPAATSVAGEIYRLMPNSTDLTVFKRAGMRGLGFAFIDRPWDYHQPSDRKENLDLGSLQQMGEAVLGLVRAFDLTDLGPGPRRDAVYFNLWGHRFVHYPAAWAPWLGLLGLGLTVAVLVRGFREGALAWRPLLRGLGVLLLGLFLACLAGALAAGLVSLIHWAWRTPSGFSLTYNPWYPLVPLATAGALMPWFLGRPRKPEVQAALPAAGLLLWSLLGAGLGLALPGASHLFQGPLLLAAAATLAFPDRLRAQVPALLATVLLWVPLGASLGTGLGFGAGLGAVLALLALLLGFLFVPLMASLREARLLYPASGAVLLVALVVGGLWARATFPSRTCEALRYARYLDTGKAWWIAERDQAGPWTRTFLDRPVPGNPSWEGDGRLRPTSQSSYLHQAAPLLPVPEPTLAVVSDTEAHALRTLRLQLDSAGAEEVWIRGEDPRLCRAVVEGHLFLHKPVVQSQGSARLAEKPSAGGWRLVLLAPPHGPLTAELTFAGGTGPLQVGLQARYAGLPAALGARALPPAGTLSLRYGNNTWVGRVVGVR